MADENDLGGKVKLDLTEFKANVSQLTQQIRVIDSGFRAAAAGMDDWTASEEGLTARIDALNKRTDLQKQKIANLTEQYKLIAAAKGEDSKAAQDLQVRINNETATLNKNLNELKNVTNNLDNFGKENTDASKDVKQLADTSDVASTKMGKFGGIISNITNSLKNIGGNVAKTAVAGVAAIGAASAASAIGIAKLGNDSAKAMNHFQIQTGNSNEQMKEFRDISKQIYADNYGENYDDIAESMAKVNQTAALTGNKLKDATEQALLFRNGFGYDVAESIDTVNTLMANFGITSKQAYTLLVQGAQAGADKNGDMLDTFKEYAPFFKTLGLSAEEFTDTLIQGAASGAFQIDKVGDAIKEFSIRSKDGSKTSIEGFQALGLNADQMFKVFAKGGPEAGKAFQDIIERLGNMKDPLAQNQAGVALFGTQFEDLGIDAVKALGDIEDFADSTASTLDDIGKIQFNDIGSALQGLKRKVITGLQPVTDIATSMISKVVSGINAGNWSEIGIAVSTGLSEMLSQLSTNLPNLSSVALTVITNLANSFMTSLPMALPVMTNVAIGLINTLVSGISTNGPLIVTAAMTAILTLINGLMLALPNLTTAAIQIIIALVNGLTQSLPTLLPVAIQAVFTLVQGLLNNLPQLISAAIKLIMAIVQGLISALPVILQQAPKIINTLINGILQVLPQLVQAAIQIINALVNFITTHLDLIIAAAIQIIIALAGGLIRAIPQIMEALPQIIGAIIKAFASVNWLEVGINIIKGIAKGIAGSFPEIADAAKKAAKSALDAAKNFLGIHSPSRVMRDQVGLMVGAGMAEGIENSQKMVNSAMAGLNKQVVTDGSINIGANNEVNTNSTKDISSSDSSYNKGNNQPIFITVQSVLEGEKIAEGTAKYDNKIQGSNISFQGRSNGL